MPRKCKPRRLQFFEFQQSTIPDDAGPFGEASEEFVNGLILLRPGYIKTRRPIELLQADQVRDSLGYELECSYDPDLAQVNGSWRVIILTMGNLILNVRGPAVNRDGLNKHLDFVAIQD